MSKTSLGVDFIIQINKGTDVAPNFVTIAGQRGAKLSHSAEAIDTTSKDSEGFKEFEYGFHEWALDADGLLVEDNEELCYLEDAFFNNQKVSVQMQTAKGNKYSGMAVITDFPIDAPFKDTATYSVKLKGDGKLVKTKLPVTP